MKSTIVRYPEREYIDANGKKIQLGDKNWRGNTSGRLIIDLLEFTSTILRKPVQDLLFAEQFAGSMTGRDVAKLVGCEYVGLDLHNGHDITKESIITQLPRPAELMFMHPPYASMIPYSGAQWGDKALDTDLSNSNLSIDDFIEMMQLSMMNAREATATGGHYAVLIGDMKQKGNFYSLQSDIIQRSKKDELVNVIIKEQFNTVSGRSSYSSNRFIPIAHEYCLLYRKKAASMYQVSYEMAANFKKMVDATWRTLIRMVMMTLGEASLDVIYAEVEKIAGHKIANNPNWKPKVRQTLQKHCTNVKRGVWAA